MKFKMQILVENDDGNEILLAENIEFERGKSSLENLGLSLAESKALLTIAANGVRNYYLYNSLINKVHYTKLHFSFIIILTNEKRCCIL